MFDKKCKKALMQMRDSLKDINQKITHLIETNKEDRVVLNNLKIIENED